MLPEWHMKKWSMSVLLKTNQNFLKQFSHVDVTSSMKNHMEYEEWLKNYAPSILGMVLQQLSVFKDVFVMQSDDILGCLLL